MSYTGQRGSVMTLWTAALASSLMGVVLAMHPLDESGLAWMSDGDRISDLDVNRRHAEVDEYPRRTAERELLNKVKKSTPRSIPTASFTMNTFETPKLVWSDEIEASTKKPKIQRRIMNADKTESITKFPFMAAVHMYDKFWCGGAIINKDLILTAAHCLQIQYNNRFFREYVKMVTVRVGSACAFTGGQTFNVTSVFFHPNYKPDLLDYNLAILRLDKKIVFGKTAQAIEMADRQIFYEDEMVTFLGWGSATSAQGAGGTLPLQRLEIPVFEHKECMEVYGAELITSHVFCAGYITATKNVCNHDAGGPAVADGALVGILSFSSSNCKEIGKPAVFHKIAPALNWAKSVAVPEPGKRQRTGTEILV